MRTLAIETSGRTGSLAAFEDQQLLREVSLPTDRRSAESFAPVLAELFEQLAWPQRSIDLVAVTVGPGSFTGLRIGVTMAKTIAYVAKADVVSVNTLEVIALRAFQEYEECASNSLWAIMDAQRDELFAARFRYDGSSLVTEIPAQIVACDDWIAMLDANAQVAGPPLAKLHERAGDLAAQSVAKNLWTPMAAAVGRLGLAAHAAGQQSDAMSLVPNYYRLSAAEEVRQAASR